MANLSIYLSTAVNGVAEIHTEILKRISSRTGTPSTPSGSRTRPTASPPRRWLGPVQPRAHQAPEQYVSPGFLTQLDWLQVLKPVIDDQIVAEFNQVKRIKKEQLVQVLRAKEGVEVNPDFLFDVQIKRLHEYKRQLLNGFSILDIYYGLKEGTITDFTPTLFLFGAKSAPGYQRAKAIIRYLNQIAKLINSDPDVAGRCR